MKTSRKRHIQENTTEESRSTSGLKVGILIGAGIILAFIAFAAVSNLSSARDSIPATNNNPYGGVSTGDTQVVKVGMRGGTYVLTPDKFTVGQKVRLEFDLSQVRGCARSVVIPEFGVRKFVKEGDNVIEFTPTKAGTFVIACSMNMYRGSFEVLEADGSTSTYVEAAPAAAGGSCGAAGGGCGCGGGA